jgi:MFS family permease
VRSDAEPGGQARCYPAADRGASLAGWRWGDQLGGWLVALPLTSGPVAFLLATDHGVDFAATAAVGMLAGTISQVAFALAYRGLAHRGRLPALVGGLLGFAVSTVALSWLQWPALATFRLVVAAVGSASLLIRRTTPGEPGLSGTPPGWDIWARMLVATGVVFAITAAAPIIGPQLAGLLSPLPVFGMVLAVFSHHAHGPAAAVGVLDGLVVGWLAPAVFFLAVALGLPALGLVAFAIATVAALMAQASTMFALPRSAARRPSPPLRGPRADPKRTHFRAGGTVCRSEAEGDPADS